MAPARSTWGCAPRREIGRGAWIDSYWFPETDLIRIGEAATVGPGTVVQTHLFQDRVMSLDTVTIQDGSTLAAHSVALPASLIGTASTVGPGSLVMRGDRVPTNAVWQGNPSSRGSARPPAVACALPREVLVFNHLAGLEVPGLHPDAVCKDLDPQSGGGLFLSLTIVSSLSPSGRYSLRMAPVLTTGKPVRPASPVPS